MKTLSEEIIKIVSKIEKTKRTAFVSCMIIGILSHLYRLTNDFFYGDSAGIFAWGG